MAKAKGSALVDAVKFLRSQGEPARKVLPEPLQHYLEERVLLSSWYPEEDLLALLRAMLRLVASPPQQFLEDAGRFAARKQSEGVYARLFQKSDDPMAIPRRGLALWSSQHDTGRIEVTIQGPGRSRVELFDYALPSPELCWIQTGYIEEMLRLAGFRAPKVTKDSCRLRGASVCSWRCAWEEA